MGEREREERWGFFERARESNQSPFFFSSSSIHSGFLLESPCFSPRLTSQRSLERDVQISELSVVRVRALAFLEDATNERDFFSFFFRPHRPLCFRFLRLDIYPDLFHLSPPSSTSPPTPPPQPLPPPSTQLHQPTSSSSSPGRHLLPFAHPLPAGHVPDEHPRGPGKGRQLAH